MSISPYEPSKCLSFGDSLLMHSVKPPFFMYIFLYMSQAGRGRGTEGRETMNSEYVIEDSVLRSAEGIFSTMITPEGVVGIGMARFKETWQ